MNIATVGDVDSGKTTLTDLLMFLSMEDRRAARGSIEAGTTLTDIGAVEVARGITINSVPAHGTFLIGDILRELTIIDTPGHKEFVHQVNNAISGLEGVLYLVDMTKPFRPHSAELFYLVRKASLPVITVLNKLDLVDELSYKHVLERLLGLMGDYGIRLQLAQSPIYRNNALVAVDDALLGMRPEKLEKRHIPELSAILAASQSDFRDSIPAVLTSGAKGIGANELLAYVFGIFNRQQPKQLHGSLQIRVMNRLLMPRGGGSVVAMVSSGELRRGVRINNSDTGERYKLSHLYDPNGNPIKTASSGDIVILGGLDSTRLATGHVLGTRQSVSKKENVLRPLVGVELSSPETHKLVEALKIITKWDPSWSYDVLNAGVMAYAFSTFHLGVLTDILEQEFKIPVTAKPFEPRYVAKPSHAIQIYGMPGIEGCSFRMDESYVVVIGQGWNSKASQNGAEQYALEKMTRQLQDYVTSLKWFGRFPIEGLDVVVKKAFSPTRKASEAIKQQALKAAVEKLLYGSQAMTLHEPHVTVEIFTRTGEELQRVEGYFKRRCPHADIRTYTSSFDEPEGGDWTEGVRQTFPNETNITMPMREYLILEVEINKLSKDGILRLLPDYYEAVPFKVARQVILQSCSGPYSIAATASARNGRMWEKSNGCPNSWHYPPRFVSDSTLPLRHADGTKPQNMQAALPGVASYDPIMPVMAAATFRKGGSR